MLGPPGGLPKDGKIGLCRTDHPEGDRLKITFHRQSQPREQNALLCIGGQWRDVVAMNWLKLEEGTEGLLLCALFPLPQHRNRKFLGIRIDQLAMRLTGPDAVRLVPPLFSREGGVIPWSAW